MADKELIGVLNRIDEHLGDISESLENIEFKLNAIEKKMS